MWDLHLHLTNFFSHLTLCKGIRVIITENTIWEVIVVLCLVLVEMAATVVLLLAVVHHNRKGHHRLVVQVAEQIQWVTCPFRVTVNRFPIQPCKTGPEVFQEGAI